MMKKTLFVFSFLMVLVSCKTGIYNGEVSFKVDHDTAARFLSSAREATGEEQDVAVTVKISGAKEDSQTQFVKTQEDLANLSFNFTALPVDNPLDVSVTVTVGDVLTLFSGTTSGVYASESGTAVNVILKEVYELLAPRIVFYVNGEIQKNLSPRVASTDQLTVGVVADKTGEKYPSWVKAKITLRKKSEDTSASPIEVSATETIKTGITGKESGLVTAEVYLRDKTKVQKAEKIFTCKDTLKESPFVLYNYSSSSYLLKITEDYNSELTEDDEIYGAYDFSIDENGDVWRIQGSGIHKLGSDYQESYGLEMSPSNLLYCDIDSGNKYVLSQYGESINIYTGNGENARAFEITSIPNNVNINSFAVSNGICYIGCYYAENDVKHYEIIAYSDSESSFASGKHVSVLDFLNVGDTNINDNNFKISDLFALDGYVYALVNNCNINQMPLTMTDEIKVLYSRGSLLKLDSELNLILQKGFTINKKIYDDLSFYLPEQEDSGAEFFGAERFIAIKPKKLYFSDSGLWVYKDGDDIKCNNINRILEVDLDSFDVEVYAKELNVKFDTETNAIKIQAHSCGGQNYICGSES